MLSEKQTETIKNQLMKHIEKGFPDDKKQFAISQIMSMGSGELEEFLVKNKLVRTQNQASGMPECVFCSIVSEQIDSHKIVENASALAVLEINPVSRGHTIIIPKKHFSSFADIPESVFSMAKNISKILKNKLKPKNIEMSSSNLFGHEIINLMPVYENDGKTEKYKADGKELSELKELLTETPRTPVSRKKVKIKSEEKLWLPKRIP